MAALQLEAAAAADHSTAAAAPLFLGDDEEANIRHHQSDSIDAGGSRFSWVPAFLGFLFLTFISAMAIVRSHGDASAVAFVGLTYADLLALFACLRMYERAPARSSARSCLLPLRAPEAGQERRGTNRRSHADRSTPWLTICGFGFLTFNSGMAIYRSQGDLQAVAFVAFSYLDLVLLFTYLMWYERAAPADSSRRDKLKIVVRLLTTLLTVAFAYRVATIMPLPMAMLVWFMAFATVCGGFYAFFLHSDQEQ